MIAPGIFYQWVPNYLRLPLLAYLFFVPLDLNGVYQGNTIDIFSDLGIYTETYTAAYNAVYIGMGLGFMIHMRLAARFPIKSLLLYGLTMQLLMHVVCALSTNPLLTILACFVLGFTKVAALKELYNCWAAIWSGTGDRSRIYPFVFSLALAGTFLLFWGMTKLAFIYNWRYAYVSIIAAIVIAILLVLLLVEHHPLHRPLPLCQMDWLGVSLLATFMMLVNYAGVYGQVEDGLNSPQIRFALLILPPLALGFLLREATVRRPVMPLDIFVTPNYIPGLLLFMTTGLFFPATVQFFYSLQVLHLELHRAEELNLYLIPGVIAGAIAARLWYQFKLPPILLITTGMLTCIVYNIIFYRHLTGVEGLQDFWLPGLAKGMGICILYISLGIQTTCKVEPKYSVTALGFLIIIRSFMARGLFTAGFTWWLYAGKIQQTTNLAEHLDPAWRYRWNTSRHTGSYYDFIQRQAYLAATAQLTRQIILAGTIVIAALLIRFALPRKKIYHLTDT